MLNQQKLQNNIFKIILSLVLLLTPVFIGVNGNISLCAVAQSNVSDSTQTIKPQTIPEKNMEAISEIGKNGVKQGGLKQSLFRFFMAMLGVVVSSLAIFGGLKLYQKFGLKNTAALDEKDYENSLESPKDFKEAINLFLNKTDK